MVVKPPKLFLQDALTNNSFSIEDTDRTLRMTLDHSFSYLYRLQRNMLIYEELFYTTRNVVPEPDYGDLWMDSREQICINFPVQLIPAQFREKFRCSKFYGTKFQYGAIVENHQLFTRLPVILIDNQVLRDFDIESYDDYFTAHLNFDRYFLHTTKFDTPNWEYEFIDHNISVQVVNNSNYFDLETNTGMLQMNSYSSHDYDRIQMAYLKNFGFQRKDGGSYFATLFFGKERLGTQLIEVIFNSEGDMELCYDKTSLDKLKGYTGAITVRLYYYRYMYKYAGYRDERNAQSDIIRMMPVGDTITSERFVIRDKDSHNYGMPIPTENILLFRSTKGDGSGIYDKPSHYPNQAITITYPNIYHIDGDDLSEEDGFQIYYFYMKPYDLTYEYMYDFFYEMMGIKWPNVPLEAIVNIVRLGDLSLLREMNAFTEENSEELLRLAAAYHSIAAVTNGYIDESYAGSLFTYLIGVEAPNFNEAILEFSTNLVDSAEPMELSIRDKRFAEVFTFVTEHPIVDYFYDEVDYVRNYSEDIHPFQYKVEKLKSFIRDDWKALLNYVRVQNKVGIKYEFSAKTMDLESRYRTAREDGRPFKEPMYVFPIQKIEPNNSLSARIFIDGLMCATFALERYEFTDFFYIPADYITEDSYIEIEVFHYYEAERVHTFTVNEPYIELDFPAKQFSRPTISDLYFYPGTEDTLERIDKDKFSLEFISGRYNYYTDDGTPISIFYKSCPHGNANKGSYYDVFGHAFTFEGQPTPENNIDTIELNAMIADGSLIEDVGYMTDNHLTIVKLEEIVTYDRVFSGETTLQEEDDKGLLYSDITKVRITLLDKSMYEEPITIAIHKKPMFKGTKLHTTAYPSYSTPVPNSQEIEEYTRAFKNGRKISRNRYDFTDYFDGIMGIQMLEKLVRGDTMGFDITPFRNRLIYYKKDIETDSLDLRGYINKPFDTKFYEVYVNGRRLNKTNLFPISPWEIKLGGLKSLHNLEIYEKDRDWEYYGLDFSNYYTISDFIREPFLDEDEIRDLIGEFPPNTDDEEELPWDKELDLISVYFEIFYYMKLVPMHFVTADKLQFNTDDIRKKYPVIDDIFHIKNSMGEDVLFLNPDLYYEAKEDDSGGIAGPSTDSSTGDGEQSEQEDANIRNRWRVFLLGNPSLENLDPDEPEENDYWEGD